MNRNLILIIAVCIIPLSSVMAQDSLWAVRFREAGINYPPTAIAIEVYKEPAVVNLWGTDGDGSYEMVWQFPICRISGTFGPKRRQGDLQVPEGVYRIDRFNPRGRFGSSFGINYPNRSDRILSDGNPGGDIFFHGQCVSVGCVSLEDEQSNQLFFIARKMSARGQKRIPVLMFPFPLSDGIMEGVRRECDDSRLVSFWENLKVVYDAWSAKRIPPRVHIDAYGRYHPAHPVEHSRTD